ncbi:MAG: hypothetical protein VB962_06805 [Pseudohongiellaceae bacterium]
MSFNYNPAATRSLRRPLDRIEDHLSLADVFELLGRVPHHKIDDDAVALVFDPGPAVLHVQFVVAVVEVFDAQKNRLRP